MSDTLTDEHHDWATEFCGIPTHDPPQPTQSAAPADATQSAGAADVKYPSAEGRLGLSLLPP